jgi:hypothetical protein
MITAFLSISIGLLLLLSAFVSRDAFAHGGGLDAYGCHHDRKRGGYHCYRSSGYFPVPRPSPTIPAETYRSTTPSPAPEHKSAAPSPHSSTLAPRSSQPTGVSSSDAISDPRERDRVQHEERSAYWRTHGYSFDSNTMSAHAMDQKVKDIERAKHWNSRGSHFNSDYMTGLCDGPKGPGHGTREILERAGIQL